MHMRLLSYLMVIFLSRSCYAAGPDDGCLLPRLERQPEGERKQGYFHICFSYYRYLLLSFSIRIRCVPDTGMPGLMKMVRIWIRWINGLIILDPCTIGSLLVWIREYVADQDPRQFQTWQVRIRGYWALRVCVRKGYNHKGIDLCNRHFAMN